MNHAHARAVCRNEYSDTLRANVRSVIAYRAEDRDGWRGPWRGSMAQAKSDARARNREQGDAAAPQSVSWSSTGLKPPDAL